LFNSAETAFDGDYTELVEELAAMIAGEPDAIANLANVSALLKDRLPDLNWAGFYLMKGGELVLGPFQGKPACIRIAVGRGVCGTAVVRKQSILVEDVHAFPGHIACDSASNSELVVPLLKDGAVVGVLDLDSPVTSRFSEEDRKGCEILVAELMRQLAVDW
jgi:L-methionine (R)-S-oxide reductase